MLFNVPQNINVEDKIAGPLTAKQLLWMFGMGGTLLVLYASIPARPVFFVVAFPVVLLFLALAFYRPQGQPLISFVVAFFFFLFRPKIYVWKRSAEPKKKVVPETVFQGVPQKRAPAVSQNEIATLAKILDTRGSEQSEEVLAYITKKQEEKQARAPKKTMLPFGSRNHK